MQQNEHLFFQLAAALIPVLLLGGAATAILKPGEHPEGRREVLGYIAMGLAVLGVVAELFAIELAFVAEPDPGKAIVVVLAVVTGTVAVGATILVPWIKPLFPWLYGRRGLGSAAVLIVVGTWLLAYDVYEEMIGTEVEKAAQDRQEAEQLFEQQDKNLRELAAIDRDISRLRLRKDLAPGQVIDLRFLLERQEIVSNRIQRQNKVFLEVVRQRSTR